MTGCIIEPPEDIYIAAMVNRSGQNVTVKSVRLHSNIPDYINLIPDDSISWTCYSLNNIANNMEIFFNGIPYKTYDKHSYHPRDPRDLTNYKQNEKGVYVYTFTTEDYQRFLDGKSQ